MDQPQPLPEDLPAPPSYGSWSLGELLPALVEQQVTGSSRVLSAALGPQLQPRVVLALIDGLGLLSREILSAHTPALDQYAHLTTLDTPFPSTTPVSLTSLGVGVSPLEHGVLGQRFSVQPDQPPFRPLQWQEQPDPLLFQPQAPLFEQAEQAGIVVSTIGPAAYESSGLTQAGLRGATYLGVENIHDEQELARQVHRASTPHPSLTYAYFPDFDKASHVHGPASLEAQEALEAADQWLATIMAHVPSHTSIFVTGDHGMIDCPPQWRIQLDERPQLWEGVRWLGGEPRARYVYCEPGHMEQVHWRWGRALTRYAWVLTRDQLLAGGYFGPLERAQQPGADFLPVADRIGDIVVIAKEQYALASTLTDERVSNLRGQHGGLLLEEARVPLLRWDKR